MEGDPTTNSHAVDQSLDIISETHRQRTQSTVPKERNSQSSQEEWMLLISPFPLENMDGCRPAGVLAVVSDFKSFKTNSSARWRKGPNNANRSEGGGCG